MPRGAERLRRKRRGQFFTPAALAEELGRYLAEDLAAAGRGEPGGAVLDPACGDGALLEVARRCGWGPLCGVDIDPDVIAGPSGAALRVGDGLQGEEGRFALVIGNPPFGGGAPGGEQRLRELARTAIWRCAPDGEPRPELAEPSAEQLRQLARHPVGPLFAERMLRAAAPEGVIALLLPESFFASRRDRGARAFLLRHARCVSVTTVYGRDFLRTGTRARTCWSVWIRRAAPVGDAERVDPPVILRQPRDEEDHELAAAPGSRAFVRRVPVGELLRCGRWDPRYHDPSWEDPLVGCRLPIEPLGRYVDDLVYGALGRGERPGLHEGPGGLLYVGQKTLEETGVVPERCPRIVDRRPFVQDRYRLRPGDLVVPRSGMGTLGKNLLTRWDGVPHGCDAEGAVVDCFNDRLALRGISSAWVLAVLRSEPGAAQIRRVISGVAQPNLSFAQIRALRMPVPGARVEAEAERRWAEVRSGRRGFDWLRELVREAVAG